MIVTGRSWNFSPMMILHRDWDKDNYLFNYSSNTHFYTLSTILLTTETPRYYQRNKRNLM